MATSVAIAAAVFPAFAADSGTLWSRVYGCQGEYSWSQALARATDGGFYLVGDPVTCSPGDLWIARVDATGEILWAEDVEEAGMAWLPRNAILTAAGGLAIVGERGLEGASDKDALLLLTDSLGQILWAKTWAAPEFEYTPEVVQTEDLGFAIAGTTRSFGASGHDLWILRLDSDGEPSWQFRYGGASTESIGSLRSLSDGGLVVAGTTSSYGAGGSDGWVLRLNSDGTVAWQYAYGTIYSDALHDIEPTSDGGFLAAGQSQGFGQGNDDGWLLRLAANGRVVWQQAYGGTGSDGWRRVQSDGQTGYVLGGFTRSFGPAGVSIYAAAFNLWLMGVDADGATQWGRAYGSCRENVETGPLRMSAAQGGGYLVAPTTKSFGNANPFQGRRAAWVLRVGDQGELAGSCWFDEPAAPAATAASAGRTATGAVPVSTTAATTELTTWTVNGPGDLATLVMCEQGRPDEVSAPGSSAPLRFADPVTLVWEDAAISGSDTFNLYRGDVETLGNDWSNDRNDFGSCLLSGLGQNQATDGEEPPPGTIWAYLVSGVNAEGEGHLGTDGACGRDRPNWNPCGGSVAVGPP